VNGGVVILIPVSLLVGGLLVSLVGSYRRSLAYPLFLLALAVAATSAYAGLVQVLRHGTIRYALGGWLPPVGIEYVLDPLSAFVAVVIVTVAAVVSVYSRASAAEELPGRDASFYGLTSLLLAGLLGMVVTGDLFNLYVFLEIASLTAYALLSSGERRAPLAAFRYVLLGTLAASFYLLGIGVLYARTGTLNMADLASLMPEIVHFRAVHVAAVFILTAFALKMALFPLHLWLPDAYTYAPSAVTGLIAPLMTKVAAYAMIRLLFFVLGVGFVRDTLQLTPWIAAASAGGIIVGSVLAIAQRDLKRMLAYSSVAQVAYIGLGVGLGNALGYIGAVLHILNHALMKSCLFLVAGNIRLRFGPLPIPEFKGLARRMPWTMAAFTVAALSMVGLPPTAGFFSKWYLVLGGVSSGAWLLVGVILVSSLLNAVYFFRVLERSYLQDNSLPREEAEPQVAFVGGGVDEVPGRNEAPAAMVLAVVVLALGVLAAGLANAFIVDGILRRGLPPGLQ
jgi:multicomponent Na+:H+ antiporter subunit D